MISKQSIWWSLIIIFSAVGTLLVVTSDIGSPVRPVMVFGFLLLCPGMALIRLLRIKDGAGELTMAIALSIALDTIVAEAMVLTRRWSPEGGLVLLAGLTVVGGVLQIVKAMINTSQREVR